MTPARADRACSNCGQPITVTTRNPNRRFCLPRCRAAHHHRRTRRRPSTELAYDVTNVVTAPDDVTNAVPTVPHDVTNGVPPAHAVPAANGVQRCPALSCRARRHRRRRPGHRGPRPHPRGDPHEPHLTTTLAAPGWSLSLSNSGVSPSGITGPGLVVEPPRCRPGPRLLARSGASPRPRTLYSFAPVRSFRAPRRTPPGSAARRRAQRSARTRCRPAPGRPGAAPAAGGSARCR